MVSLCVFCKLLLLWTLTHATCLIFMFKVPGAFVTLFAGYNYGKDGIVCACYKQSDRKVLEWLNGLTVKVVYV